MPKQQRLVGYYFLWTAIGINLLLFIFKIFAGLSSNSIAMIADAFDTLSDTVTSAIVFFGFWMASQPADQEHPFGHGRAESITAIIISTIISIAGIKILYDSIHGFFYPRVVHFGNLEIGIFIFAVIVKILLYFAAISFSRKTKSAALMADGLHHRSDAITTAVIVIGSIIGVNIWWLDSALGLIVAGLIFYSGYEIMRSSVSVLLGENADDKLISEVTQVIAVINPQIKDLHDFKLHHYGEYRELTLHIKLPGEMTVSSASEIIDKAEERILAELKIKATLHIEPHNIK